MVKKLLKYEFASLSKSILPMEIILLCTALFTRIVQFFETDSTAFKIFMYSSVILLVIAILVCIIMTITVCVIRFYKNMYSAEGYLTLTLPVTHGQHLAAKLISSLIATLVSVISVIVAVMIATAGDVFHEIVKAAVYLINVAADYFKYNFWLFGLELLVGIIVWFTALYLLMFTCLTVGQMAKKNRVLAAFGVYFGYYIFRQILGTIFIIVFVAIQNTAFINGIRDFSKVHPLGFTHIVFCFIIVFYAVLSVVYFAVTKFVMKRKLNLE